MIFKGNPSICKGIPLIFKGNPMILKGIYLFSKISIDLKKKSDDF